MSELRWKRGQNARTLALSGAEVIGGVSPAGDRWTWDVWVLGLRGHGVEHTGPDAAAAVERAWSCWCVSAELVGAGWRDIATAPRDGTLVDLSDGESRYPDCYWGDPWDDPEECCWRQRYAEASGSSFRLDDVTPTHWLPIPPMPGGGVAP